MKPRQLCSLALGLKYVLHKVGFNEVSFREKGVALVLDELGDNVQVEKHYFLGEILILNMGSEAA